MIRVALFLVAIGCLALGVAWIADRPGDVVITWQGRHIEMSVMVLGEIALARDGRSDIQLSRHRRDFVPAGHPRPAPAPSPRCARLRGDVERLDRHRRR